MTKDVPTLTMRFVAFLQHREGHVIHFCAPYAYSTKRSSETVPCGIPLGVNRAHFQYQIYTDCICGAPRRLCTFGTLSNILPCLQSAGAPIRVPGIFRQRTGIHNSPKVRQRGESEHQKVLSGMTVSANHEGEARNLRKVIKHFRYDVREVSQLCEHFHYCTQWMPVQ